MSAENDGTERPNVMPAGSMPPEKAAPAPDPEPEPLLGKFAGTDELAAGYTELEKKLGEQGNENGNLKQMNQMLLEQLQSKSGQEAATEPEADAFDYESEIATLSKAVEDGEMSVADALVKSNDLATQRATRDAMTKYEEVTQKRTVEQTQQQFLDDNPDFLELRQTGALEQVKKSLPGLHDDFSAYYALKANEANEALTAQKETDRIAGGDERTKKVLNAPGSPATKIGKGPERLSSGALKQQTMAKLAALDG
ncbi:MAG: hypothetical protein JEZ12_13110 [Desulfobacterium sp.]|nr:hypothetical protein [Desulfobacterium sp.]